MEATPSTEKQWLSEGIASGKIREHIGIELMKLLDRIPSEFNDVTVNPTSFSNMSDDEPLGDNFPVIPND